MRSISSLYSVNPQYNYIAVRDPLARGPQDPIRRSFPSLGSTKRHCFRIFSWLFASDSSSHAVFSGCLDLPSPIPDICRNHHNWLCLNVTNCVKYANWNTKIAFHTVDTIQVSNFMASNCGCLKKKRDKYPVCHRYHQYHRHHHHQYHHHHQWW